MKQLPNIQRVIFYMDVDCTPNKYSYYFVTRVKKSHPWECKSFFYSCGDTCIAAARDHFKVHGFNDDGDFSLIRIIDQDQWHDIQVRQHLKQLKIK